MNIDFVENALWRVENAGADQTKLDIIDSFMGSDSTADEFEERLVELLKYADAPNRSDGELRDAGLMRVPKDADGMFVHVGDEMCGYGYPNGGVYCQAIINSCMIFVGTDSISPRSWLLWSASDCHHYRKPTVVELLHMFLSESEDAIRKGYDGVPDEVFAEYAERIREVIDGD